MSQRTAAPVAGLRRDRKAEIADAAADLFRDLGYHGVGIDDVGRAVGITGGAIYRHFANKGEILARVLFDRLDLLDGVVVDLPGDDAQGRLDAALGRLVRLAFDTRGFGILLQREIRHLGSEEARTVLRRLDAVTDEFARLVGEVRRDLSAADARLLAASILSAAASPSYHTVPLPRPQGEDCLRAAADAIVQSGAVPASGDDEGRFLVPTPRRRPLARRASRREMLLDASIHLFGSRGYSTVRMEDVGAVAGITGPSIYQHFSGKAELLVATLNRGNEWLQLGLSQVLATSGSAREALEGVVASYVRFVVDHPDLISLLLTETVYLPGAERHALRRMQHDYVSEWRALLTDIRNDLTEHEALFLTHCVIAMVNAAGRRARIWRRAKLHDVHAVLTTLGLEVLGVRDDRRPR